MYALGQLNTGRKIVSHICKAIGKTHPVWCQVKIEQYCIDQNTLSTKALTASKVYAESIALWAYNYYIYTQI